MNLKSAVVGNETQFAELIHKEAHARACRTNDLGKCFLTYFWNNEFRFSFFPKVGEKQKNPCESFLTGIKELIHKILFNANVAGEHISQEQCREVGLCVKQTVECFLL